MAKATNADGSLQLLGKCVIITPYPAPYDKINLRILPELTDSKAANYQNEPILGRTTPVTTYSSSEPRTISSDLTFMITRCQDIQDNLRYMRIIESLVYPGPAAGGAPFTPPPICHFVCGKLLGDQGVCVVLKNYSVRFQTDVAWDVETYLPYKFTVSCQWEVVYACKNLPTNDKIRTLTVDWPCPPRSKDMPL